MYSLNNIEINIKNILKKLDGRAVLLAATKTVPAEVINSTYGFGVRVIGENRVNELMQKYPLLDKRFEIHFIGTLQRNKVKHIIDKVSLIHSLDSLPLAEEIEKQAERHGRIMDCLLEVNIGNEESKSGIPFEKIDGFLAEMHKFGHLKIKGLMAIPPNYAEIEKNILNFKKISEKFIDIKGKKVDNVNMDILSLGMSSDWELAVGYGSSLVRVGQGIFGARNNK